MSGPQTSVMPPWRSDIAGLVWPPVVDGLGAIVAAYGARLAETQWLPAAEIAALQRAQLAQLAAHCAAHSPGFRARLAAAGLTADDLAAPGGLARLAPLTRRMLQDGNGQTCAHVPEAHLPLGESATSGSTGEPVVVRRTSLNQLDWMAMTVRDHLWQRRDPAAALVSSSAKHAVAERQDDWGAPLALLYHTGPLLVVPATLDVAALLRTVREFAPGCLVIYPGLLAALLDLVAADGQGLPGLHHLRCIGETVSPALRDAARTVLGLAVEDAYSSQECGYIALQCPDSADPDRPVYHVMAETHLVEVVDSAGEPCAPGQIGRVLITDLHNFATPLIRYDISDYAEAAAPCGCGRGLPTIGRIVGRERNLIRHADGTRHWPLVGFAGFRAVAPVRQYQLVQHALDGIEVRLVVDRPLDGGEEQALGAVISAALGAEFALTYRYYPDRIPTGPNGKFDEFLCQLA